MQKKLVFNPWALVALLVCLGISTSLTPPTMAAPVIPATADEAIAVIDLTSLPRLKEQTVFELTPTMTNYIGKTSVKAADAFYRATLEEEGWKLVAGAEHVAAEYTSRLFTKEGFYVQVSIGAGDKGTVSVLSQNLGNVDVRELPRHDKAKPAEGSTPVNVTYITKLGLAEAAKYCSTELGKLGWKEVKDEAAAATDVPHVKMLSLRQNDSRLQVVIYRDPAKLKEGPTSVSLMSHAVVSPAPKRPDPKVAATTKPARTPAVPAEADEDGPPVKSKTKPADGEEKEEDDVAATIKAAQKELQDTLKRELGKLGKEMKEGGADVDLDGALDALIGGKGKKGTPKIKLPQVDDGDDDDDLPKKPAKPAKAAQFFQGGKVRASISVDDEKIPLTHAAAIRFVDEEEQVTLIYLSDKPLKYEKLKRGKPGSVALFDVVADGSKGSLSIRATADFCNVNLSTEGSSLSLSTSKIKPKFDIKEGKLIGEAQLPEPEEFFDKRINFQLNVELAADSTAGSAPSKSPGDAPAEGDDELTPSEDYDLPIPEDRIETSQEKTKYRSEITTRVEARLAQVLKFYRREMPKRKFTENVKSAHLYDDGANLSFTGPDGDVQVNLKAEDDETQIVLTSRNDKLAKEHGIVPKAGRVLLLLGNAGDAAVVVVVDGKEHKLAAGLGARDPSKALKLDIAPGKHSVHVKGGDPEELEIAAGSAWGVIVPPGESTIFAALMY